MRDNEIRALLHNDYLNHYKEDGSSLVLDEFPVCAGRTIADLVVVNGSLHAFEIKGSFDTLSRLNRQLTNYTKVFDYITVVTTANHLKSVLKHAPSYCGVWLISGEGESSTREVIRPAQRNRDIESFSIAQLLWRDEAVELLTRRGLSKGLKTKRRWLIWEELAAAIPTRDLSNEVRHLIKDRLNWKSTVKRTRAMRE